MLENIKKNEADLLVQSKHSIRENLLIRITAACAYPGSNPGLVAAAGRWELLMGPSSDERINKTGPVPTLEWCSVSERKVVLTHAPTRMKLDGLLSEKATYKKTSTA